MDGVLFFLMMIGIFIVAVILGAAISGTITALYIYSHRRVKRRYHYASPADPYQFTMDRNITTGGTESIDGSHAMDDYQH